MDDSLTSSPPARQFCRRVLDLCDEPTIVSERCEVAREMAQSASTITAFCLGGREPAPISLSPRLAYEVPKPDLHRQQQPMYPTSEVRKWKDLRGKRRYLRGGFPFSRPLQRSRGMDDPVAEIVPDTPPDLTHPRRFPKNFERFLPRNGGGEKARVAAPWGLYCWRRCCRQSFSRLSFPSRRSRRE